MKIALLLSFKHKASMTMKNFILKATLGLIFCGTAIQADACTRVVYKGPNQTVMTGRTMDFSMPIPANLWIFPRGMQRSGEVGPNSIKWTSKFGSVVASSWDIATADGMNEKGLVANMLWLVESEYPAFSMDGDVPGMSISLWAQYALDNFATVAEAVAAFEKQTFAIVSDFIPGSDKFTTIHLSLSDRSGDNAILEFIGGKLVIHQSPDYVVMTNSPTYEKQLAIRGYWEQIPGTIMLPGTNRAADRFVRASFYLKSIPQTDNTRVAVASVFSVIRNTSVPYGFSTPDQPDISNTQWRVVADQKDLVYYFESVLLPNVFWVDLKKVDFSSRGGVRKLEVGTSQTYAGEASGKFIKTQPFKFQGL
jgi:penicillin V acylase-like amidase (Ntn superfamily)